MKLSDELMDMGYENIYNAHQGEQWEEISFNVTEYCVHMQHNGLPYMFYKICKYHDFYCKYHFSLETCYNLCLELNKGYPMENSYHNYYHIIDSLQAMHYFMSICGL